MAKKKKPKKPYGLFLALAFLPGCATWGVLRQQVVPSVISTVQVAGPGLASAALQDVFTILGFPIEQTADLLGLNEPAGEPGTPESGTPQ